MTIKKDMKEFTITMERGTRFGGKYRNADEARKDHEAFGKVAKVEQRPLWTPEEEAEMDADKAWHRAY
tara:strand:- start:156 stop:359 length:204 start_codon:yes stop_codon:yes gene_type:complete